MTKIAVIGAGQMGSGIAQVFAAADFLVKITDISPAIFEKSRQRISASLEKLYSKSAVSEPPEKIIGRISYHANIQELSDCGVFIESVSEDFEIKNNILRRLNGILTAKSYVATNTSSYSITSLSQSLARPQNFLGFHFMNPAPVIDLIEVVRGADTSDETFIFFRRLAEKIRKTPIGVRDSPGFVLNRILIPMINEAVWVLYENVSSAEQIDTAMTLGAKYPIGPLALADLIGLDTVWEILKNLQKELGEKYAPCPLLEKYIADGRLGRKTNSGFYRY